MPWAPTFQTRLSRREEIPAPSAAKRGQRLVLVPWWPVPKLALYLAMRAQGIHNAALARRLKVSRMLDPAHDYQAEKIQRPLAALGKRLVMGPESAGQFPGFRQNLTAARRQALA